MGEDVERRVRLISGRVDADVERRERDTEDPVDEQTRAWTDEDVPAELRQGVGHRFVPVEVSTVPRIEERSLAGGGLTEKEESTGGRHLGGERPGRSHRESPVRERAPRRTARGDGSPYGHPNTSSALEVEDRPRREPVGSGAAPAAGRHVRCLLGRGRGHSCTSQGRRSIRIGCPSGEYGGIPPCPNQVSMKVWRTEGHHGAPTPAAPPLIAHPCSANT